MINTVLCPMSHSKSDTLVCITVFTYFSPGKRNTSLAFFTSHERSLLKSTWGSQATRLSRDSFLPFASCQLCLQIARDPVACAANGDIFCRECAVSNLLAQGKEIKRLKKEDERRQREVEEEKLDRGAEEKERAIAQFERTMMGMEGGGKKEGKIGVSEEVERNEGRGVKRKFELDEDEMLKNAKEERAKARRALDEEKVRNKWYVSYIGVHGRLTTSSRLSQHSPHSGCHLSRHPQIMHRQARSQSYRPSVQPPPLRTSTLCR